MRSLTPIRPDALALAIAAAAITLAACGSTTTGPTPATHVIGRCVLGYANTIDNRRQFFPGHPVPGDTSNPVPALQITLTNHGPGTATVDALTVVFRSGSAEAGRSALNIAPVTVTPGKPVTLYLAGAIPLQAAVPEEHSGPFTSCAVTWAIS